jgi:hypothetical protein
LSSWIKQGTSSDVSNSSANFMVQPRLLRRFLGGLCWTQTDVGQWFIIAQRKPTGRQADSPIPSPRRHVIGSCGRATQDCTLWWPLTLPGHSLRLLLSAEHALKQVENTCLGLKYLDSKDTKAQTQRDLPLGTDSPVDTRKRLVCTIFGALCVISILPRLGRIFK